MREKFLFPIAGETRTEVSEGKRIQFTKHCTMGTHTDIFTYPIFTGILPVIYLSSQKARGYSISFKAS